MNAASYTDFSNLADHYVSGARMSHFTECQLPCLLTPPVSFANISGESDYDSGKRIKTRLRGDMVNLLHRVPKKWGICTKE